MPAITASTSPRSSARTPSSCAPAPRACATSAPAWRRRRRSTCCRAWRRCRCAWRATSRTPARSSPSSKANPAVERIASPELPDHPDHALAKKLLPKGAGSIFSFDIKGGREAGRRFIERLKLFSHLANVGDAKSLVIHPASTTHAQLDAAALKEAGIGEGMIRLSVGLEDPDDLLDDLGQALRAAAKG